MSEKKEAAITWNDTPIGYIEDPNETRYNDIYTRLIEINSPKNPVMYVFVNKGLNLSVGKIAAQVAHAQEELLADIFDSNDKELRTSQIQCMKQNPRTVIVLEAKDTEELYKINSYLESCKIRTGIYVDERGDNYLLEPTALACQYLDKCDPRTETIFKMFKLYEVCEVQPDLQPHLEKACSLLEHLSYLSCHPSNKGVLGNIQKCKFRLDVLEDVAEWDEYAYKNNLLKYIKPKD